MTQVLDIGQQSEVERVDEFEKAILDRHEIQDLEPVNHYSPGVYCREVFMPQGCVVVGHLHKTRHQNVVLSGRCLVSMDGQMMELRAGDVLESAPNVRKALLILEDCRWMTIHPNPNDLEEKELEKLLVEKSPKYEEYKKMQEETNSLIERFEGCLLDS